MNFGKFAGTLAGQLRAKTPGELIAVIGDVVAPPLESDEEEYESGSEYTDDEEEYYDEDDEEEDEEETVLKMEAETQREEEESFVFESSNDENDHVAKVKEMKLFSNEEEREKWFSVIDDTRTKSMGQDERLYGEEIPKKDSTNNITLPIKYGNNDDVTKSYTNNFATTIAIATSPVEVESIKANSVNDQDENSTIKDVSTSNTIVEEKQRPAPTLTTLHDNNINEDVKYDKKNHLKEKDTIKVFADHNNEQENSKDSIIPNKSDLNEKGKDNKKNHLEEEEKIKVSTDHNNEKERSKETTVQKRDISDSKENEVILPITEANGIVDNDCTKEMSEKIANLEKMLAAQERQSSQQLLQVQNLLKEASLKNEQLQQYAQSIENKRQADAHRHDRAIRQFEVRDKELNTMLNDGQHEIEEIKRNAEQLKKLVIENQKTISKKDNEIIALKTLNDDYKAIIDANKHDLESKEQDNFRLQEEKQKLEGIQMELQMLEEARDRDRNEIQSNLESASNDRAIISSERDAAKAQVLDLQNQLAAAIADLDIVKADYERAIIANDNMEQALTAMQDERETERGIQEEQILRKHIADAEKHRTELEALQEINEKKLQTTRFEHESAMKLLEEKSKSMENTIAQQQRDYLNTRRSLDEAIHRLQMSQEDVIDRTTMKNILLDWNSKRGPHKKQVLELMASLLHFTDEQKRVMGIHDQMAGKAALQSVVGAVAAPLPQPALQIDKLEGGSVREKWINFLMAETGGDDDEGAKGNTNANGQ